jgi:hypothetical protein
LVLFGLLVPSAANANAIIPYMAVPWGQVFLLPAVVVIEGLILWRLLSGRLLPALGQSFVANLASTLVGAALYFATMPLVGESLFQWWFKGGFSSEAVRNAFIALTFAAVLWAVSWAVESIVIARMRKSPVWRGVSRPCAIANAVTYVSLFGLSLLFQR